MDIFTWGLILLVVALVWLLIGTLVRLDKLKTSHKARLRADLGLMAYAAWYIRKGQTKPALAQRLEDRGRAMAVELDDVPWLPTDSCMFNGIVFSGEIAEGTIKAESITANSITVGNISTQQ